MLYRLIFEISTPAGQDGDPLAWALKKKMTEMVRDSLAVATVISVNKMAECGNFHEYPRSKGEMEYQAEQERERVRNELKDLLAKSELAAKELRRALDELDTQQPELVCPGH